MQAEVFVFRMGESGLELTGPCGADAWYIESHDEDDPMEVVRRLSSNLMGPPLLVHSTSWRRGRGGVLLTFAVVLDDGQAMELSGIPVGRAELARNTATSAATGVLPAQVIEHALRHMAWLTKDDEAVRSTLSAEWKQALEGYVPEPFQHLG